MAKAPIVVQKQELPPDNCSCNTKLYQLCRLGHTTRHFNVGQYRRKQKGEDLQDAAFFDHNNTVRFHLACCRA